MNIGICMCKLFSTIRRVKCIFWLYTRREDRERGYSRIGILRYLTNRKSSSPERHAKRFVGSPHRACRKFKSWRRPNWNNARLYRDYQRPRNGGKCNEVFRQIQSFLWNHGVTLYPNVLKAPSKKKRDV